MKPDARQIGKLRKIEKIKRLLLKIGLGMRDGYWLSRVFKYLPLPYIWKVHLNATEKPSYAFGLYSAAFQAKMLGLSRITVIEFGVASGKGLRAMENIAARLENIFEIKFDVVGFDVGSGLIDTGDVRDLVYWFVPGVFKVNTDDVRRSLKRSEYIVGEISQTLTSFTETLSSPIGFISFDFDHYTATVSAMKILNVSSDHRLPRVICYLDDTIGISDLTLPCDGVGEALAVHEFNQLRAPNGIFKVEGLRHKRAIPAYWNDQMYAFHDFDHPDYNTAINPTVS